MQIIYSLQCGCTAYLQSPAKQQTLVSLLHSLLLQNLSPQTSISFYAFGSFIQTQFCSSGKTAYLEIPSLHSFLSYLPLLVGCCILFYSHLLKSLGLVPFLLPSIVHASPCTALHYSILPLLLSLEHLSWLSHLLFSSNLRWSLLFRCCWPSFWYKAILFAVSYVESLLSRPKEKD